MSLNKVLYIPIEESHRDLEARLLLAQFALEDGFTVVFGQQWLLNTAAEILPAGIFFFKGTNRRQGDWMKNARSFGHRIVAVDEESVPIAEPFLLQLFMCPEAVEPLDLYLAQSDYHAEQILEGHAELEGRVEVAGVPRFDLLKPEFVARRAAAVEKLIERYGDFVLVNTNFGYANTNWGTPDRFLNEIAAGAGLFDKDNDVHVDFWAKQLEFEQKTLEAFKHLIADMAKDARVILRPHPSEDMTVWQALEQSVGPNLSVIREGSAIDWILASKVLVQNSCTTGIEALVLGHPTLSYAPFDNGILDTFVGNRVLEPIQDRQRVAATARDLLAGERGQGFYGTGELERLGRYVSDLDGYATVAQWSRIRSRFDADGDASERIFSMPTLEITNLPEWAEKKFDVAPEQLQAILEMIWQGLGRKVDVAGRILGKNLFALRRT